MPEESVRIQCNDNGPYLVRGSVTLLDGEGNELDTAGRPSIALCRCGGSLNKPFCDGTHASIGFEAETRAAV